MVGKRVVEQVLGVVQPPQLRFAASLEADDAPPAPTFCALVGYKSLALQAPVFPP